MEGPVLDGGRTARDVQFHVLCFYAWDDERGSLASLRLPATVPDEVSAATAYRGHLIVTLATELAGAWGVAVVVRDDDGVLVMESPDLGGGVTFDTKALADHAGVLFARAWIDRRS